MSLALALALAPVLYPLAPLQEAPATRTADESASRAQAAAARASAWLVRQQQPNGSWLPGAEPVPMKPAPGGGGVSDDAFWDEVLSGGTPDLAPEATPKKRSGEDVYTVGVTGLALLSLCADGQLGAEAPHRSAALRAAGWLLSQQDEKTGCIGDRAGFAFLYDHAIATLALLAVHREDAGASLKLAADADSAAIALAPRLQSALDFIKRARNPYRVWRYEVPPAGDNDTSITAWMTLAHASGKAQGLEVDRHATEAIIGWMDDMTEEGTGRVGYDESGSASSRVPGANVQFDVTDAETLTAAGLMCRLELRESQMLGASVSHVKCILRALPEGDEELRDALWVYFGTRALAAVGSKPWRLWRDQVVSRAVADQTTKGPLTGSWAPRTAWSYASGRVGTTALMSLAASIASNQ